jgi:hypothetical protein
MVARQRTNSGVPRKRVFEEFSPGIVIPTRATNPDPLPETHDGPWVTGSGPICSLPHGWYRLEGQL